jgi:purine nucleosidase
VLALLRELVMTKMNLMDCDPGWDDCLALLLLLGKGVGNPKITGVSTTWGNADIYTTTMNARLMTGYCGWGYVFGGRDGPLGPIGPASVAKPITWKNLTVHPSPGSLGTYDAIAFLLERVNFFGRDLTILATGPLTNIATAIMLDTAAMQQVGSLVIIGGALANKNTDEFNLSGDQEATEIVLKAGLNTVLIPFETLQKMNNPQVWLKIQGMTTDHAKFYASVIDDQRAQGNGEAAEGLFDQLGALYVLNPGLFRTEQWKVHVDFSQNCMGRIVQDPAGSPVTVVTDLDVEGVNNLFLERLS